MEKNRILDLARCTVLIGCMGLFFSCGLPFSISNPLLTPQEHVNLGVTYENIHDFDGAEREYRIASKEIPIAHLYLGNVYFIRGRFDEAEKEYLKAIRKTNDPHALNNLAWLYYTRDVNLEEAEKAAQAAVNARPENEEFGDTLTKVREKRTIETLRPEIVR